MMCEPQNQSGDKLPSLYGKNYVQGFFSKSGAKNFLEFKKQILKELF